MTTTTIKRLARSFFSLRPIRNYAISTQRANIALAFVLITQFADLVSTSVGITYAGATEANGIMASLLAQYGLLGFALVKTLGAAFLGWHSYRRKYAPWIIGGLYTLVLANNIAVILWL
jgi:hypothetical protein